LLARSTPAARIDRPADDTYLNFTGGTTACRRVCSQIGRSTGNALVPRPVPRRVHRPDPVEFAAERATGPSPVSAIPRRP
jgi:hypothetical protein